MSLIAPCEAAVRKGEAVEAGGLIGEIRWHIRGLGGIRAIDTAQDVSEGRVEKR